jgi:hypothetical protein
MAKSSQTFRKRQRETKLREKAQLKRERRQQRKDEKKALLAAPSPLPSTIQAEPTGVGSGAEVNAKGESSIDSESTVS